MDLTKDDTPEPGEHSFNPSVVPELPFILLPENVPMTDILDTIRNYPYLEVSCEEWTEESFTASQSYLRRVNSLRDPAQFQDASHRWFQEYDQALRNHYCAEAEVEFHHAEANLQGPSGHPWPRLFTAGPDVQGPAPVFEFLFAWSMGSQRV